MTSYWCEHAVLPGGVRRSVRIGVQRDRVRDVVPDVPAQAEDTVLRGVVLPGLANGHSHAFHRALRGRTHEDGGNFWSWRQAMYAVTHRLDPDTYHALATAVFAEMLLAGYTAVGEFHYVHHAAGGRPYGDPNAMGLAVLEAARDVGIRITLLDTCYLTGGLTASGHVPLDDVQSRFSPGCSDRCTCRGRPSEATSSPTAARSSRGTALTECTAAPTRAPSSPVRSATRSRHASTVPSENLDCTSSSGTWPLAVSPPVR